MEKQKTQTTGYQIQYATDKKFKSNKKTITVKKNSTTSKTINKLKSKKKYYIHIRAYKSVGNTKVLLKTEQCKTKWKGEI